MTKQLTFGFEDEAIAVKEPAIVRKSDPETSHAAAEFVRPKLSEVEGRMLRMFEQLGKPSTALEAAGECMACCDTNGTNRETHRKRYTGLLAKGYIRKCGKKQCRLTGQLVTAYEVIGASA